MTFPDTSGKVIAKIGYYSDFHNKTMTFFKDIKKRDSRFNHEWGAAFLFSFKSLKENF